MWKTYALVLALVALPLIWLCTLLTPAIITVLMIVAPIGVWAWLFLAVLLTLAALVWRWWVAIPVLCMGALVSFAFLYYHFALVPQWQYRWSHTAAPPLRFPAIVRINLTYTPPYGGGSPSPPMITRHTTDAATIHRFTTAFEHLVAGLDTRVSMYGGNCSLNEGEDGTVSFVPVHDRRSGLAGVQTQTFHVIYGCSLIWTGPYEYGDWDGTRLGGIETMVRQAAGLNQRRVRCGLADIWPTEPLRMVATRALAVVELRLWHGSHHSAASPIDRAMAPCKGRTPPFRPWPLPPVGRSWHYNLLAGLIGFAIGFMIVGLLNSM